jgi:hypothetical protein
MKPLAKVVLAGGAVFALGLLAGWRLYRCQELPAEPPAPAIHQPDGSLILERSPSGKPSANPEAPVLKPAGMLPKGAVVERNVQIVVEPSRPTLAIPKPAHSETDFYLPHPGVPDLSAAFQCPDVTVDLSLIKLKDQTQRVIASSPDGKIIGGLDVPVRAQPFPKPQRWTAQAMAGYDTRQSKQVFGGQVSRNLGPFTVSVGAIGNTAFAAAGIHF